METILLKLVRFYLPLIACGIFLYATDNFAACTVNASGLNFGTYDVFNASPNDVTGTNNIQITCDARTQNIGINLSVGDCSGSTFTQRKLCSLSTSDTLNYNIYRNIAERDTGLPWGDCTGGSTCYTNITIPKNQTRSYSTYGRTPAGQDVSVGTYNSNITVTVNY